MESPYRSLVGPLMRYIDAVQKERADDVVTVSCRSWSRASGGTASCTTRPRPLLRFALASRRDVFLVSARYFLER